MRLIIVVIVSTIVLFLHEGGHYCAAKLLGLQIDKISFSWRPFPRVYIAVLEKGVTNFKRVVYLLSGNLTTISLFIILNIVSTEGIELLLLIVSIQIIFETNPFLSDYSSIIFWAANKRNLDKIPKYICNEEQEKEIQEYLKGLQESFFLSPAWIIHFLIWTILLIFLLKVYIVK